MDEAVVRTEHEPAVLREAAAAYPIRKVTVVPVGALGRRSPRHNATARSDSATAPALQSQVSSVVRRPGRGTAVGEVLLRLEDAGLLLPAERMTGPRRRISAQRRENLARKLTSGRPLSELVMDDRAERC